METKKKRGRPVTGRAKKVITVRLPQDLTDWINSQSIDRTQIICTAIYNLKAIMNSTEISIKHLITEEDAALILKASSNLGVVQLACELKDRGFTTETVLAWIKGEIDPGSKLSQSIQQHLSSN